MNNQITKVVNLNKESYDIYIGRRSEGEHFGNPFSHLDVVNTIKVKNRTEAIEKFRDWLLGKIYSNVEQERRKFILQNIISLKGKKLGCYCKPKKCHGDVLIEFLEEYLHFGFL